MVEHTDTTLQQALALWPQWSIELAAEPRLEKILNSGRSHNTYQVSSGLQQFAVRLENQQSRELAMAKAQEVSLMQAAGKLAPAIIWTDEHTLVTEFIHGTPWQPPENMARLCQTLQQLHAQDLDLPAFDLAQHCDHYWQKILDSDTPITAASRTLFTQCRELLGRILVTYPAQVLCHNDLNPDNIFCRGNEFVFLDWEYACYNSPYFELATLVECFNLTSDQTLQLSENYWSHSRPKFHLDALESFRIVVRLTEWLWLTLKQDDAVLACELRLKNLLKSCD